MCHVHSRIPAYSLSLLLLARSHSGLPFLVWVQLGNRQLLVEEVANGAEERHDNHQDDQLTDNAHALHVEEGHLCLAHLASNLRLLLSLQLVGVVFNLRVHHNLLLRHVNGFFAFV